MKVICVRSAPRQRVIAVRCKLFDARDLLSINIGQGRQYSLAIDMHRAGAAQAPHRRRTTTEFRAGRLKMIAQRPEQWCIIAGTDVLRFSVKG